MGNEDKIAECPNGVLVGVMGPFADRSSFTEVVTKNLALYELKNGVALSPAAAAAWVRNLLAESIRRAPYNVMTLMAGYSEEEKDAELYFLDRYAGNFCVGILDKEWRADMSVEQGLALIKKCIEEIKLRYVPGKLSKFLIKIVTKDGVKTMSGDDL